MRKKRRIKQLEHELADMKEHWEGYYFLSIVVDVNDITMIRVPLSRAKSGVRAGHPEVFKTGDGIKVYLEDRRHRHLASSNYP